MKKKGDHILLLLFAAISGTGLYFHEIWQDEAQHMLLARDSTSLSDLVSNCRFQGHPILWNFLLWGGIKFLPGIFVMKLLNWLFITGCAGMIIYRFPSRSRLPILFCFHYFFIYEYGVISRNSAMLIFFIFLCLDALGREKRFLFFFSIFLILLSHFFGIFFLGALTAYILADRRSMTFVFRNRISGVFTVLLLLFAGFLVSYHFPPADHIQSEIHRSPLITVERLERSLTGPYKSFFHIPPPDPLAGWNENFITRHLKWLALPLSALLLLAPFLFFWREKKILLFWSVASFGLILFFYFSPVMVGLRHAGFFFLFFLCAIWIAGIKGIMFQDPMRKIFLGIILGTGIFSGIFMLGKDILFPFSGARELATFIRSRYPGEKKIVLTGHSSGPAVSAYLGKKIFYPEKGSVGSYTEWNTHPFILDAGQLIKRLDDFAIREKDTSLLVINSWYYQRLISENFTASAKEFQLVFVKEFPHSMVATERYLLFYLVPGPS